MLKILYLMFIVTVFTVGIEIDFGVLQEIVNENPHALKEKVLLAKHYIKKGNVLKARVLIDSVLEEDKNNTTANVLDKYLKTKEKNRTLFRKLHIPYPVKSQKAENFLKNSYDDNNSKLYKQAYRAFVDENVILKDDCHIKASYLYMQDGNYILSKRALNSLKHKGNLDKTKIEADICYKTKKYVCAVKFLKKLYNTNKNIDTGLKLLDSYYNIGNINKAKKLYAKLYIKMPKNKTLKDFKNKIATTDEKHKTLARKKYEKSKDANSLREYCDVLYASGEKEEALNVLQKYNKSSATDETLLLEAKYLSWMQKLDKSLHILSPLIDKNIMTAKLLAGQILSWKGELEKSKEYLKEVVKTTKDKELLYEGSKALAFAYKWSNDNEKAKKLFLVLKKEKKEDKEVKEALMELGGDYKSLIKIYKDKPLDRENMKRLSDFYFHNNQKDLAIDVLKSYLKKNPKDLETTKNLALMLIDKKDYYNGFANLEYYTAQKNDENSSLLLAKQYYWSGFTKEAIDILNSLINAHPNNKDAINLRAEIFKVSPRFTTSNSNATVGDYFNSIGIKQLKIADTLYFNAHYASSLMYYENYISKNPDNYDVRLRYAFALEKSGKFPKAEGEFMLMLMKRDSDEIKYHYAYNLMMNGKLSQAEKAFHKLKKEEYKPISTKLQNFLNRWKKAWQTKNFSKYEKYYTKNITDNGLWRKNIQHNFSYTSAISVKFRDIVYKKSKDASKYLVKFYEEVSTNKGVKKGNSILEIVCDNQQRECQIDKENFSMGEYVKFSSLKKVINQHLKDIKLFRSNPELLEDIIYKKKIL